MQLYRKNNFIINVAKHKGTIEEKNSDIKIPGLVREQGKTKYGENPFKFFFSLDYH